MKDGRRFGGPPKPYQPPETPAGKINLTDLDSRNVKTLRGWVQGYNAQAVCTEDQIVIAAEVTISSADFGQLEPMVTATETELAAAGVTDAPEVVLADAGYWHTEQIERLTGRGTVVLIPPDAGKRKGARPGWDGGLYAFMRRVLATDRGGELYRRRNGMIEPVFAHTKFNRRIDRFQRRGRAAARSEWRLITATHNLLKLHTHTLAASRRLRAPAARARDRERSTPTPHRDGPTARDLYATATMQTSSPPRDKGHRRFRLNSIARRSPSLRSQRQQRDPEHNRVGLLGAVARRGTDRGRMEALAPVGGAWR